MAVTSTQAGDTILKGLLVSGELAVFALPKRSGKAVCILVGRTLAIELEAWLGSMLKLAKLGTCLPANHEMYARLLSRRG